VPKLRAHSIAVSLDGYMAGPDQGPDHPLGVGGEALHGWAFATRAFQAQSGAGAAAPTDGGSPDGGSPDDNPDERFIARGVAGIGATVMGRNMFGPVRGGWGTGDWRGWWGEDPPYHHPVFVLTHHPRPPLPMAGGTTFHFVTDGIQAALARAFDAAGGLDVRLGGGASTIQQYLRAGLLDELHVAVVPVLLGGGQRLFDRVDPVAAGLTCVEFTGSASVAHVRLARTGTG